jgi:hypothetical protein
VAQRKQRTLSHVVADVGVKHVEHLAAQAGFTTLVVPTGGDYGYDIPIFTFDDRGQPENGYIFLQIKSSAKLKKLRDGSIACRIKKKHLRHWLGEPMPVIVVRYDNSAKKAYWIYVQRYFAKQRAFSLREARKTVTIRIPKGNIVTIAAFKHFAQCKRDVIIQAAKVIDHA